MATRLLPDPVGVASTTWSPEARASDRLLLVGVQRPPATAGPCGERVDHVRRVGARRREEVDERSHVAPVWPGRGTLRLTGSLPSRLPPRLGGETPWHSKTTIPASRSSISTPSPMPTRIRTGTTTHDEPDSNPTLVRTESCDLCIVGGGYTGPVDGDHRQGARPVTRRRPDRRARDRLRGERPQRRLHGVEPHPRRRQRPGAVPRGARRCSRSSACRTSTTSRPRSSGTTSTATTSAPA